MVRLLQLWRISARDLSLLWFALRHRSRPIWLLPAVCLLGLYAIEPLNFALPVLGAIDDLILLPIVLHVLAALLPADIRQGFSRGVHTRGVHTRGVHTRGVRSRAA
jgi:uncharacterized membrane protein YkvA (DUF1232 family)